MADRDKIGQLINKTPLNGKQASELIGEIQRSGGGVKDIGGALADSLINDFGINLKEEKSLSILGSKLKAGKSVVSNNKRTISPDGKTKVDVDVETTKGKVDEKIKKAAHRVSKDLGGNDKLNQLVNEETEKLVKGRDIKTKKETLEGIQEKLAKEMGVEVNDEIRVNSRKIFEEARNIERNNPKEVNEIKRNALIKEIEDGYEKSNPGGINDEQRKLVKDQATMVADTFYTGKVIDVETRDEILAGSVWQGKAALGQYWTDTEGLIKLLQKTPDEVKDLQGKFSGIKDGLSTLIQPTNIRELASFNSLMSVLGNEGIMSNFNLGQNRLLSFADSLTGGAIGRTFTNFGSNFISRIGTESVKSFAENSLKVFAENSFPQAFSTVLSGLASGGAKAAATSAATAAVTTAATAGTAVAEAAMGPPGWLALAGKFLLDGFKKIGEGLDKLFTNGRGDDEDVKKITKHKWLLLIMAPAIFMVGCTYQNSIISTLPPTQKVEKEESLDTEEYDLITANNISVPTCNPNVNSRAILREIALSVEGKVHYSLASRWFVIGPHGSWGKRDTTSELFKRIAHPYYGMDCAKFVSWVWLQCMGKTRGGKELGNTRKLLSTTNKNTPGWHYIHPRSLADLKIGDIFLRDNDGANHAVLYIGNGQTLESARQNNNPFRDTVYSFSSNGVFLSRNKNRMNAKTVYDHIIRIDNVFKD